VWEVIGGRVMVVVSVAMAFVLTNLLQYQVQDAGVTKSARKRDAQERRRSGSHCIGSPEF
jgi:hypothetical protein